jgi:exosortase F-associated protein
MKNKWFVFIGCFGLVLVYIFQMQIFYDPYQNFTLNNVTANVPELEVMHYILSKIFRYALNDGFALLIIWGLFANKKYMRFAVLIFLIGLFLLLPLYLVLSITFYPNSFTFLNHLHRIVLNPVLMMLLIPAFYYQQSLAARGS